MVTIRTNSVDVVLPTYREKDSIRDAAERFSKLPYVNSVLVVNNNAEPGTDEEVQDLAKIKIIHEPVQGYGAAIKRGLRSSDAEFTAICEPDGTFYPEDLEKLLQYMDGRQLVIGSRTVDSFIYDGANMGWFLKWGNWAVAKIVEVLFNSNNLTDVGCTFRVMTSKFRSEFLLEKTNDGSFYGLQMMLFAVKNKKDSIQIPVHYGPRVGTSSVTGSKWKTIKLGTRMVIEIFLAKLRRTSKLGD